MKEKNDIHLAKEARNPLLRFLWISAGLLFVGLGAIGPNFAALVYEYVHDHFDGGNNGRFVSVLGYA